jgi:hypothetical protein
MLLLLPSPSDKKSASFVDAPLLGVGVLSNRDMKSTLLF